MTTIGQIEPNSTGGLCNTGDSSPPPKTAEIKKKQGKKEPRWDCTWHITNETKTLEQIEQLFTKYCKFVKGQMELTKKDGKHLQICFHLKVRARLTELKKMFGNIPSFRVAQKWHKLCNYVQKQDSKVENGWTFIYGINVWKPLDILQKNQLYDWQEQIIEIIEKEPNNRIIHWYWEPLGKVGKSTFCKYLCVKYDGLILSGKSADMKYAIANIVVKNKQPYPRLIVFDIPRTSKDYISYTGMEEVKNGLFFSSKYESGMVIGNCPHIFVFCNFEPNLETMSKDRWKITNLSNLKKGVCYISEDVENNEELIP